MPRPNNPKPVDPALIVRLLEVGPLNPHRRMGWRFALVFAHGETAYFVDRNRPLELVDRERLILANLPDPSQN